MSKKINLAAILFTKSVELKSTRDGFGEGILEAANKDERVVALSADVAESTRLGSFIEKFPERFIQVGVCEQALVTIAAGMANYGKIPFATSYAIFSPGRNWEQIRTTICLNDVPVKIVGSHSGINVGADGATHQALEDIALMRVLPNMVVVISCDAIEAKKATLAAAKTDHPLYLRLTREKSPVMTSEKTPFKIGRAETFWESKDPQVAIIACGPLVYEALIAAKELDKKGIEVLVINSHTVKPLDEQTIIRAAKTTGAVVTAEEHQVSGGMGSAVAEVLAKNFPVPIGFVGMEDKYGESGKAKELLEKYGMKAKDIIETVKKVLKRKVEG